MKPQECRPNECGVTFVQTDDILKHRRIQTGDKPYRCNLCENACNVGSDFLSTQTGEKLYDCEVFGERFTRLLVFINTHIHHLWDLGPRGPGPQVHCCRVAL